ncbi:keratin-associated protein 10-8-like isoform X1 [Spodoptera litura]|uniref:Keratin-associated protein 10-8-like isoform X1 n=1 Tax=Spodoptera litura TaxID=69820 RepID=A0A9J7E0L1_SPOLT|nr:keratin-associated protein 10-8-like isoform X1 [Spodoptera litura]
MECCYQPNCEEYAVTPMLVAPAPPCAPKYCDEEPACMPCLPRCQKPVYYCCTKEPPPKRDYYCCTKVAPKRDCCPLPPQTVCCPVSPQTVCCRPRSTPPRHDSCGHGGHGGHGGHPPPQPQQQACNSCCAQPPPNKPVKTKYIIPCYRYEDGRITNQPTVLMRRACEVACGARPRRKPFVCSSYSADPYNEIRRFHSEDERGNCCYHFERKKPPKDSPGSGCTAFGPCQACYTDCVFARAVDSPDCCYYCT